MGNNIQYKGMKSTRLRFTALLFIISTGLLLVGMRFGIPMTVDQWTNFQIWLFGTYSLSENLAKGAEAYRDKAHAD